MMDRDDIERKVVMLMSQNSSFSERDYSLFSRIVELGFFIGKKL